MLRLEDECGGDGVGGPLELCQESIAAQLPHASVVSSDGVAEPAKGSLNPFVGQVLIALNEGGRTRNVCVQENGKLPGSMRHSHVYFPEG